MAQELLERRVEEEKRLVTLKLPVSAVNVLDGYSKWLNRDRVEVVEALIKTLLDSREFSSHFNNGSNGKGK
jgi:hypothetical protein